MWQRVTGLQQLHRHGVGVDVKVTCDFQRWVDLLVQFKTALALSCATTVCKHTEHTVSRRTTTCSITSCICQTTRIYLQSVASPILLNENTSSMYRYYIYIEKCFHF